MKMPRYTRPPAGDNADASLAREDATGDQTQRK